ncbi:Putative HTH-type transcriptional regulator ywnA [Corynebacterium kutscheri]|uniref:HTH-type transcriptional regulator ywnA n=1 Tax=Corynebacterium kutscheri TaxID=35755 RepID=A0A0F6TDP2_9CORY|nr:Rrf2 family transcriptional regulator [Corynebacterium kutscheri]AKE41111.1 putative transcriptional regulator [Corynebacterium kutscheri]VEH07019.1 Putative HTH-type transcriptional regulator ywnA [Corynebacterium kutscheri]VEH09429.1 Putative HTH-type transcriptional regulator ywnA [Corynebacterium kutscheri]VEH79515.1 Putative HTH-type transcriptional regulator ywnA [Corynebacterium kutscheri]
MDTKFAQAIHALVYISETTEIASSQALAKSVGTNPSHIRKITSMLKQAALIESSQGKAGFTLVKPKESITLAEIYQAVHPDKYLFNLHQTPHPQCPIGKRISLVLKPTFDQFKQDLANSLGTKTLSQLIDDLYYSTNNSTL